MRRIALGTALSLILAACSADSLGPDPAVLVGSFGSALDPVELLATRVGVQLNLGCGGYFITREAVRIDGTGGFSVRGKSYPGGGLYLGPLRDAVLSGTRDAVARSVDVTLRVEGAGPQAPPHYVLHEGDHFDGELVCPQ
jgi:hypothetical protein